MNGIDWQTLRRLRRTYLEGTAGLRDYWQSDADLEAYDRTFAQRIGWKWDFVLADLEARGWRPPRGTVLDWGCGSGVAARACLDHFGRTEITRLHYADRSAQAVQYATRKAGMKYPGLEVAAGAVESPTVLLLSHVLTELSPEQVEALLELALTAETVLWVEPGSFEVSLALIAIRERLRTVFHCVSPCPHQGRCGILAKGNEAHWCHHFATPPSAVFQDPDWGRFAALLEIDLRSLPLSYLVLDRRPAPAPPADTVRVLGRPRIEKAGARLLGCAAEGVREFRLPKRTLPEAFHRFRKGRWPSWQRWACRQDEITEILAS
ncbi:MAG: hypothetical protein H7A45_18850 [Verrucomicrobiales bacterium]|nr:hypothetical protein [Verrucomicrobiales bacterium]MCP5525779.1 hypothetical protein [Verrucomicrobiales bacterium]